MTVTDPAAGLRDRPVRHESFLVYARFRYLKIACAAAAVSLLLYVVDSPYGSRYGGSWAGYTLGIAGALLILWLMWFGYRKRSYLKEQGNLVAWLSATSISDSVFSLSPPSIPVFISLGIFTPSLLR
jgi:hypothetical protein